MVGLSFGAVSNNVRDDVDSFTQFDEPLQINNSEINADTDLVTITIGGNDAEFADILKRCALQGCIQLDVGFRQSVEKQIDLVGDELFQTYDQIRAQAPNASIWVLGYPQLFPEGIVQQLCPALTSWSLEVQDWMRARTTQMNQVIDAATTALDRAGTPLDPDFAG